jgi:hypothetical protein
MPADNDKEAIVLSGHIETGLVLNTQNVDIWDFPDTAAGVCTLAMARYAIKQSRAEEIYDDQTKQPHDAQEAALEKALTNPETFKEWMVNAIHRMREIMLNEFAGMEVDTMTILNRVYIDASSRMIISIPEGCFTSRLANGERAPIDDFIIDEMGPLMLSIEKWLHTKRCFGTTLKELEYVPINNISGLLQKGFNKHMSSGKMSLWKFISCMLDNLGEHINSQIVTPYVWKGGFQRALAAFISNEVRGQWVAFQLCGFDKNYSYPNVQEATDRTLCRLLSPLPECDKHIPETMRGAVPSFDNLPELQSQIRILMQRLSVKGKVHDLLEAHLFKGKRPVSEFQQRYSKAGKFLGTTKKNLLKELEVSAHRDLGCEIEMVYNMLEFSASMCARADMLKGISKDKRQLEEANLLMEVADVYGDYLKKLAMELELKMTVIPLTELPEISHIAATMVSFGEGGQNIRKVARQALDEMKMAQAAAKETEKL